MNDQSVTLPATPASLPDAWVERLFCRMEDRYGQKWADAYGAFPRDRVKATWAEDLADLAVDELKAGLAACRDRPWPPTLPEFRSLCRPALDYERAFLEAVEQMRKRESGADVWPTPALYWAAAKIGNDLSYYTYAHLKTRWHAALDDAIEEVRSGRLPHTVPGRTAALPAPGKVSSEVAQANIAKIHAMFENSRLKKRAA